MNDDWVLVYERGSRYFSLLAVPFSVLCIFGAALCLGNLLEIAGLLRLPQSLKFGFTSSFAGQTWSEWTVIAAYFLLVAGLGCCLLTWRVLSRNWGSIAGCLSAQVVSQTVVSHIRFEYPGRAPAIRARNKSTNSSWLLTAGDKKWRLHHSQQRPFEYLIKPGAEIRVKHPGRGGPDDFQELWVQKGALHLETAPLKKDEWVQVLGQPGLWKVLFGSLMVVLLYLPCVIFIGVASFFVMFVWIANLLHFAGLVTLPHNLDLNVQQEWARAVPYEKALLVLGYLAAGVIAAVMAWNILKGLWARLAAEFLPPLVYEGPLEEVYEAPRNRYGLYWKLTAGGTYWIVNGYTSGGDRSWFAHEITPGRQIRVLYTRGGGRAISELWLKEKDLLFDEKDRAAFADELVDSGKGEADDGVTEV